MSKSKRTPEESENAESIFDRALERFEQRKEEKIDSIAAGIGNECEPEKDAGCTAARASAHRAPASASAGVHSSNTPPPSSKLDEFENWIGAEDWFEWCLYVEWNDWRTLNKRLKCAKEFAAMDGSPSELCDILFMGGTATVDPSGARLGKKGPYFAYKLTFDELTVLIAERASAHKTFPSVIVCATGQACLYPGAWDCYKNAARMVKSLSGTIIRNRLSRVDICLDMPEVDIKPFDRAFLEERYICRAVVKARHSGTGVTVSIGKSPLMCRIYDKKAEVELKANPNRRLGMQFFRWHGVFPESAIRIEFEMRRETLKERGIDSVEDYYAKRADLIDYLTTKWLRFTANKVDRGNKNQSKARTLPLWNQVHEAFNCWAGETPGLSLAPLPKEQANVRNLIKQAVGVTYAAARFQGKEPESTDDCIVFLIDEIDKYGIIMKPNKRR